MNRTSLIVFVAVVAAITGAYAIYTRTGNREIQEPQVSEQVAPIPTLSPAASPERVGDNVETMTDDEKKRFMVEAEKMERVIMERDDPMPGKAELITSGGFLPRFRGVKGQALLVAEGGENTLRFENFDMDNGPDLRVYLSADLGKDNIVDLGGIRATRGNVNYAVPTGTDIGIYRNVLVWSEPFGVLFSYAELHNL